MDKFLPGKINKIIFFLILFFLPMIVCDTFFNYDYEISSIVSIILTIFFVNKLKSNAIKKQTDSENIPKPFIIACLIIVALSFRFELFGIISKYSSLTPKSNWNVLKDIINTIIIAPISEELTFRLASVEMFKDNKVNKRSQIVFIIVMTLIWNFAHSLSTIDISIILIGLLLYIIYFLSRNIWYCIVFHSLINLITCILMSPVQTNTKPLLENNLFLIINVIVLIIANVLLIKNLKKSTNIK